MPKENYVRINLKKRVFVRGKKNFNYRRFKYGQWLKRHQNRRAFGDSSVTCKPSKLKEDRSDEDLDNASLDQVTDRK